MFPLNGPACSCLCSHAFVGRDKYRGVRGLDGAVSMFGKGAFEPRGALGIGGLGGLVLWELGPDAVRPGLCGLVGGWARLTRSSPNESDSLSDSGIWRSLDCARIDCVNFNFFAGNRVSLNFTSWEIKKCWCIPELVSLGSRFITNKDHSSALRLKLMSSVF